MARDRYQRWIDEIQNIVSDFVQNNDELGELMLDYSESYWEECFEEGLTPQQALEDFKHKLSNTNILAEFRQWRASQ